jgi:hypothetical protein
MIACLMVAIHNHGLGGVEADSTPREYCFQVDSVEFTDGTIELNGFAFRYEHPSSDYSLLLRSKGGTRKKLVHIPLSECGATAEIGHAFRTN